MHEIKIYGDIVHVTDKTDKNVSLADVQDQLLKADGRDVKVRIGSDGGDANEGFAIYNELRRYAKQNKARIHTFAESRLSSIATVIFLAGDERELSADLQPFVHKAHFSGVDDLDEKQKEVLKTVNTRIAQHYANHTELTFQEALSLMENETFIDTKEAKAMRFATSIEKVLRPVALQRFNNTNLEEMNKNKKTPSIMAKAEAFLKSVGLIAKNKLVMTADEVELDFYELEEDEVIEVGANVRIDGDDSVTADYVMKSGETYKIVDGVLAEIVEAGADNTSEDAVALQAEIDALTSQLEAITNKAVELEATNKSQSVIIANLKKVGSKQPPKEEGRPAPKEENSTEKGAKAKSAVAGLINKKPLTK